MYQLSILNSSPPGQTAAILADDIFKWIFLNENDRVPIEISLKFVPGSLVDNKPALVPIMAITRTNADPVHRRVYAVLGGDEPARLAEAF